VADQGMTAGSGADRHDSDYATGARGVRVGVTGAAGLIGWPLTLALVGDDRVAEVVAIDRARPQARLPNGVRWVERDVRDPRLATDLAGIDALVHLAFSELGAGDANLVAARRAAEAALGAAATAIVHASSATVYGAAPDNPVPLTEDDPPRPPPEFPYPQTKIRIERMLDELGGGTRVVHLRPTTTLGRGAHLLLAGRWYVSLSDFDPPMQFTWVEDVAAAFLAAVHAPAGGVFNVGAPGTLAASEVAAALGVRSLRLPHRPRRRAAAALSRLRVPGALDPRFVDLARYPIVVDSARAERELGWRPRLDSVGALRQFREVALES
jgi:UDP-glucose 4-epimerase